MKNDNDNDSDGVINDNERIFITPKTNEMCQYN